MNLEALGQHAEQWQNTEPMPVLFVGHDSPMNAEDNDSISYFDDKNVAGSLTMTSLKIEYAK